MLLCPFQGNLTAVGEGSRLREVLGFAAFQVLWVVVKITTLNNRCRIILGAQKGTIILTTTHMALRGVVFGFGARARSDSAGL